MVPVHANVGTKQACSLRLGLLFLAMFLPYGALAVVQAGYMGCYVGGDYVSEYSSLNNTVQLCQRACYRSGYTYAVLYTSATCQCADQLDSQTSESYCATSCAGDATQICGSAQESVWLTDPQYIDCENNGGCGSGGTCSDSPSGYTECLCPGSNSGNYSCPTDAPTPAPTTRAPTLTPTTSAPTSTSNSTTLAPTSIPTSPPTAAPTAGAAPTSISPSGGKSNSSSAATIGGAVGGTLAGLLICALGLGFFYVRRRKPSAAGTKPSPEPTSSPQPPPAWDSKLLVNWDEEAVVANEEKVSVADKAGSGTAQQIHGKKMLVADEARLGPAEQVHNQRMVATNVAGLGVVEQSYSAHRAPAVAQQPRSPAPLPAADPWQPAANRRDDAPVADAVIGIGLATTVGMAGVFAVGKHVPWASSVICLLKEVVDLFETVNDNRNNCRQIVQWAHGMVYVLSSIDHQFQDQDAPPAAQPLMTQAKSSLHDLLTVAIRYNKASAFKQYAVSGICQKAFSTADSNLRRALAALNLSLTQDVLSSVREIQLQVDDRHNMVIESLARQHALLEGLNIRLVQFANQLASNGSHDGSGGAGGEIIAVDAVAAALERLQIPAEDVELMGAHIGQGTFARVFPCHYQGEVRAAKVVTLADCTSISQVNEVYKRFARELYIMSTLKSTKVIKVFGAITDAQQLTIVMELGERGSLRGVLDDPTLSEPMTEAIRHLILKDIAGGMAYLYSKGVQHRDLKSLNVLIMHDWHAKISDFGLSKTRQSLSTLTAKTDFRGGTWAWKAPELLDGAADFTEKSDVYSFGVIVWEVICGGVNRPWHELDTVQLVASVRQGNRLLIDQRCSQECRAIMQGAWKAPADRPTFSAICADLRTSLLAIDQKH